MARIKQACKRIVKRRFPVAKNIVMKKNKEEKKKHETCNTSSTSSSDEILITSSSSSKSSSSSSSDERIPEPPKKRKKPIKRLNSNARTRSAIGCKKTLFKNSNASSPSKCVNSVSISDQIAQLVPKDIIDDILNKAQRNINVIENGSADLVKKVFNSFSFTFLENHAYMHASLDARCDGKGKRLVDKTQVSFFYQPCSRVDCEKCEEISDCGWCRSFYGFCLQDFVDVTPNSFQTLTI